MQPTPSSPRVSSSPSSIQRLSIEYDGWWISSGVPSSARIAAARSVRSGEYDEIPAYNARPGHDRGVQRPHRLLERGLRVGTVRVEDVDVVQPHPGQRGVQRGQQVLARTPVAVRTGPHVVAGLGGDHQLVAVRPEVLGEHPAEVGLRGSVGRAVVVGQVEMGDAEVERPPQDGPLGGQRIDVTEVLPEPERHRGQVQPAAADPAVGHVVVAIVGGEIAHGAQSCSSRAWTVVQTRHRSEASCRPRMARGGDCRSAGTRNPHF